MNEEVNGSEHAAAAPPHIKKLQEEIPHFGEAWRVEHYQNPDHPDRTIMALFPRSDLVHDVAHLPKFFSKLAILTRQGPLEVGFAIPGAVSVDDAAAKWRAAAQLALFEMHKQMQEQSKRIVVPGTAAPTAPFKKIQLQ